MSTRRLSPHTPPSPAARGHFRPLRRWIFWCLPLALGIASGLTTVFPSLADPPAATSEIAWIPHPSKPFSITATETTVAQFRACVGAGACNPSTASASCNYGKTGFESHPVNCVTYGGAEQFCTFIGGRVCTESEWLDACRGEDGRAYPYGETFDLAACNTQSTTLTLEGRSRGTAPVASHPQCVGGLPGLHDMAGNVAEWVDNCKGDYCKFRGAGYLSNDPVDSFAGCSGICSGNDKSLQSGVVGIRCCKDAAP